MDLTIVDECDKSIEPASSSLADFWGKRQKETFEECCRYGSAHPYFAIEIVVEWDAPNNYVPTSDLTSKATDGRDFAPLDTKDPVTVRYGQAEITFRFVSAPPNGLARAGAENDTLKASAGSHSTFLVVGVSCGSLVEFCAHFRPYKLA